MKSTSKTGNKRSNTTIKSLQPSKKQQTITSGQQKLDSFFKTKQQNQVQKNGSINATRDNSNVIVDNSIVYSPSSSLLHNTVESESIQQSDIDIKAIKNTLAEKTSTIDHSTTKNKANEPLSIGSVATFSDTSITMIDKNNNKNDYKYSLVYKSTESDSQVSHNLLNTQEESIDSNNNKDNNASTFFDNSMYTEQFNHMIDTVLDGESFLFTKNNLNRFKIFKQLIKESQHLIVRLWMRNRRWIRMSKLDYSTTISDIYQASKELSKCGLIYIDDENNDSDNNNNILTWDTMMNLINMDEIKELTRLYNCELLTGKTKSDYIIALTKSYQQSKQLRSNILHNKQKDPYIQKIKQILGPCIIMDSDYYALFQRLNIVYYRLRDPTETNSMKAAILSKISKRHYPDYIYNRTENIWKSIEDLDQYETAFYLQRDFEMKMESIILERRIRNRKNQDKKNNNISNDDNNDDDDFNEHNDRQLWMDCWIICENIVGLWEELVQKRPLSMDIDRPYFMRRFEAGWIYTHMIEHGTKALSRLQEYSLEAVILQKLIDQEIYRLGKRGKWYERLALIQSKYLKDIPERTRKKMALQTCINGIQDPKVHQIYINSLQKRIQRLERDLCIPKREQHDFSYLTLKKPSEKIIYGEKLSDSTGKKSIWRADDGATISVEEVAIQYYNKTGYQGLHTENGVVTMLYTLLFWDVIFSPIPGVFETPYQTAPLDLATDAFYVGRIGMINERLDLIGQNNSNYLDIIRKVYEQHSPLKTMCDGVNWNYNLEDLLEIAECIGSESLSALCRLLAEEYGFRLGGMPDLCTWNYKEKKCLFVEVKGPGDKLSETQKIWLDALTTMGIPVEVCYVKVWDGEDVFLNK